MSAAPHRVLGVLGGMGPLATADFCARLTALAGADRDQDHVPAVIVSDPRVPDRTEAIVSGREDEVVAALLAGLRRLEAAGAEGIAIPCNTAHYWLPRLVGASKLDWIAMQDAVLEALRAATPPGARVAVLATRGTLLADIYGPVLARGGYRRCYLSQAANAMVWSVIDKVKAGRMAEARDEMGKVLTALAAEADAAILACTELPLAVPPGPSPLTLIDSTEALARACVAWSLHKDMPA